MKFPAGAAHRPRSPQIPSWRSRMLILVAASLLSACLGSSGPTVRATHDPVALEPEPPVSAAAPAVLEPGETASWAEPAGLRAELGGAPDVPEATRTEAPTDARGVAGRAPPSQPIASGAPSAGAAAPASTPAAKTAAEPGPGLGEPRGAAPRAAQGDAQGQVDGATLSDPTKVHAPVDPEVPFRVPGAALPALAIPRDEKLVYDVTLNLGVISPDVGTVTIASKVEPFRASPLLLAAASPTSAGEQAVLSARAEGSYAVYTLDELITCAHLPQSFPSILHRSTQSGSENRRRELMLGRRDGKFVSVYRRDAHCKKCSQKAHFIEPTWAWRDAAHCSGCKRAEHRVWRDPVTRDAPEGAVDMLSAVYVARTMILDGRETADFQLMDREELWDVRLKRGKSKKRVEVPAGEFEAYEITLQTSVPSSETGRDEADFSGLFGIHGELSIWVEAKTGVPIWIRGVVPVGPIELDVGVELAAFRGTPRDFKPLR